MSVKISEVTKLFNKKNKKLAVMKLGGIGDSFLLLILAHAIKRKYPNSDITIYMRDKLPIFKRDNTINTIVYTGKEIDWDKLVKQEAPKYDLFFDDRYLVGIWEKGILRKECDIDKYWNMFNYLNSYKCNLLEMSAISAGVCLIKQDFNFDYLIQNNKLIDVIDYEYIIINNGDTKTQKTKTYNIMSWNEVIRGLKKINSNIKILQVGTKQETKLQDIIDLRGKLTLEETLSLIKNAKLVICTEGLFGHLAKIYNTKAIVLFGSTKIENFCHLENINISGKLSCSGCWYSTANWFTVCPKNKIPYCRSVNSILPATILTKAFPIIVN